LTGAGMFVGTVVAGIVIVHAGGVKCRGALVRDLLMFIVTLVVVYSFFETGMIGPTAVHTFLWMYGGFVLVVLLADIYHRAVVLPRMRELEQQNMIVIPEAVVEEDDNSNRRQQHDSNNQNQHVSFSPPASSNNSANNSDGDYGLLTDDGSSSDGSKGSRDKLINLKDSSEDQGGVELTATNAYANNTQDPVNTSTVASAAAASPAKTEETFMDNPNENNYTSTDDDDSNGDNTTSLGMKKATKKKRYKYGVRRPKMMKKNRKKTQFEDGTNMNTNARPSTAKKVTDTVAQGVDTIMTALSNYGPDEGNPNTQESFSGWSGGLEVTSESMDKPVKLHGTNGILNKKSEDEMIDVVEDEENNSDNIGGPTSSYRMILENVDNMCTIDGSSSSGMSISWGTSFATGWHELIDHFSDYYNEIFTNEENNSLDKFLLVCELPFTVLRKLSISTPCDDYYCRGLVAASFALAPAWFGVYCLYERHSNLFYSGGFPVIELATIFSVLIAILVLKFSPAEEKDMSLKVSVPIAFIGFMIAATWIDTIADQLVRLLTLLGVLCRIPGSVMGLTILAWGNSMGDLSANMTMAKKGLANMAITACFAGPVFNILIGLGGGFAKLNLSAGQEYAEVEMSAPISVGFLFLLANCVLVLAGGLIWNSGHIPQGYGYIALALYVVYIISSVWLEFTSGNNN
jgi:Ca2+/Na+ antiporter